MAATQKDPVLVVVQLIWWQRLPEYSDPVQQWALPRQSQSRLDWRQPDHASGQDLRLPVLPRVHEAILGRGQARHHARRRLPRFAALAFPLHGHLAHLRGRQGRDRGLVGPRGARVRPEERECGHGRELRSMPVPRPIHAGCSGGLRGRPARDLRLPAGHPGPASAPGGAGSFRANVHADPGQRRDGVSRHHRSGLARRVRTS